MFQHASETPGGNPTNVANISQLLNEYLGERHALHLQGQWWD